MKRILTISILLAFASTAEAKQKVQCRAPESFVKEIYNCGKNELAAQYAEQCADALQKEAQAAGRSLQLVMDLLNKNAKNGQNQSMKDTVQRLELGIPVMEAQIAELEDNTEVILKYTDVMIDFEDGVDEESSAECFNTAYHRLEKVIDRLDTYMDQTTAAKEQAEQLLALTKSRSAGLDGLSNSVAARQQLRAPAAAQPVPLARSKRSGSDITGVEEARKREQPKQ